MTVAVIFIEPFIREQVMFSVFWFNTLPFTSINPQLQEPLEQLLLNVTLNEYDVFTMAGLPSLIL